MPVETKCSYQSFAQVSGLKFESKDKKKTQAANYGEQVFSGSKPISAVCCPNLVHCSGIQLEAEISRT